MEKSTSTLSGLSILISFYNKQEFLEELVENLIQLLERGAKVIMVNDGSESTVRSSLLEQESNLRQISDRQFTLLHQHNMGSAFTRNHLISLVATPYFIFLDADDLVDVESLQYVYNRLLIRNKSSAKELDLVISNIYNMDCNIIGKMPLEVEQEEVFRIENDIRLYQSMGYWRYIYRTNFILRNQIAFLPTFRQIGMRFILDDVFWMIQISSVRSFLMITSPKVAFYKYRRPEFTKESRVHYRKQEAQMAKATLLYFAHKKKCQRKVHEVEKLMLMLNLESSFLDLTPRSKKKNLPLFVLAIIRVTGLFPSSFTISKIYLFVRYAFKGS